MAKRNIFSNLVLVFLLITVALGSWLTALAMQAGNLEQVVIRIGISTLVGVYYLVLFYVSLGYKLFDQTIERAEG